MTLTRTPLALSAALTLLACGASQVPPPAEPEPTPAVRPAGYSDQRWGQELSQSLACISCHALQQPSIVGPSLDSMAGGARTFQDGSALVVSGPAGEQYLRSSITAPSAQVVVGFQPVMPTYSPSEGELAALVAYLQCFGEGACEQVPACAEVDPCRPR